MSWKKTTQTVLLSITIAFGLPTAALAACATGVQTCSSSYSVGETFFGSGGNLSSCGTTYCSKQSAGETAVGNTKSTSYQAQAGFNTDRIPSIELYVNTSSVYLGYLNTTNTVTTTASFHVKTYLASGYVVQTSSPGPTYGSHTMSSPSNPIVAAPGTEQFGMNLVANNSCGVNGMPASLGNNPLQVPSSSYSYGAAATNYDQSCKFMYRNGDVIAQSNKSSGETDYTLSYIFNINSGTPAGLYSMNQVIVATSTF